MRINIQTKIWGKSHSSLTALAAALALSGCVTTDDPDYSVCEPVPPATDCGDDVEIEVE